jgi:reactive intermediate/imine deaminase
MRTFRVLLLPAAAAAMTLVACAPAGERPQVEYHPADEGLQAAARAGGFRLPFSSAVRVGDVLYLSGMIGTGSDGKLARGIEAQTRQTMDNIGAALARAGRSFDDVFKCTVMIDDMKEWQAFNAVYVTYFKPDLLPARSAFGADGLALGALVEVECLAHAPPR